MNQLCDFTAGNLHFFKKFRFDSHYKNLIHRIKKTLTRDQGFECVMRTRFSNSLKIGNFMTPVLISHNDLLRMSSVDEDMSLTFNLEYQMSKISQGTGDKTLSYIKPEESDPFIYLQTAVLYTHRDGTRRVRVHNFCVPTSSRISDIHDSIDCEAYASFLFKLQIDKVFKSKKMINSILYSEEIFKTFISAIFNNIQMHSKELPENIEYLPLYFCGILKNRVCCKDEIGLKLDIDTSNFIRIKILRMSDNEIINFIYPKFFQIHHLMLDKSLGVKDDDGNVNLPEIVSAHSNSLENDGVYLIDNGYILILYIKLQCNPELVDNLFGVKSLTEIKSQVQESNIIGRENDICNRLTNIIDYLRSSKTFYQNLMIVFETTDSERL